jgi:hypothetical protein
MPGWRATSAGRLFQPSQPQHAFELFERIEEFESLAQVMSAMAALIKAHSDPGLDKSSIHFTRPKSPREDRNRLIWKHGRQKVSRFRATSAAHEAVSGTPFGVRALCCRLPGVWPFRPNPGLISIHPCSG